MHCGIYSNEVNVKQEDKSGKEKMRYGVGRNSCYNKPINRILKNNECPGQCLWHSRLSQVPALPLMSQLPANGLGKQQRWQVLGPRTLVGDL